jgi:hypothetical protein
MLEEPQSHDKTIQVCSEAIRLGHLNAIIPVLLKTPYQIVIVTPVKKGMVIRIKT